MSDISGFATTRELKRVGLVLRFVSLGVLGACSEKEYHRYLLRYRFSPL